MPNPQPTGTGETQGLEARQSSGPANPLRPALAAANNAAYGKPCDVPSGHADGETDLTRDPWSYFG